MSNNDDGANSPVPGAGKPENGSNRDTSERRVIMGRLIRRIFGGQVAVLLAAGVFMGIGIVFPDRLAALPLAFLSGTIGGSLSLLKRIRRVDLEVLQEIESSLITTLMPFLYGGILALITYLLFIGGVLTGEGGGGLFTSNLFPNFTAGASSEDGGVDMRVIIATKPASVKDMALLLIWSLLSGYSEKFVDRILRTLEKQNA